MPTKYICYKCRGAGVLYDNPTPPLSNTGYSNDKSQKENSTGFLVILAFVSLILASFSYFYSATIFFDYWAGQSLQNFGHFAIYTIFGIILLLVVSRYFGFVIGFLVGIIFTLPVIHSIVEDTGFYWIIFRSEATASTTQFLRWCSFISVLLLHGVFAYQSSVSGRDFRSVPGKWWVARGIVGRILIILLGLIVTVLTFSIILSIQYF